MEVERMIRKFITFGIIMALMAILFASIPFFTAADAESEPMYVEGPPGLTIGFWKNNIAKNIGEKNGKPQVSLDDIVDILKGIKNPHFKGLEPREAWKILSIKKASSTYDKGMAHILAAILTCSYFEYGSEDEVYLPDIAPVDDPELPFEGSYWEAIELIKKIFFHPELSYGQEVGLALADALNNIGEDGYAEVEQI
jgi:hypothetical protein